MGEHRTTGFQDYTVFEDGMLWNASLELLNLIKRELGDKLKDKRVLELGSGLGHLGLGLAELGANVTLTEHPAIVDRLKKRVDEYKASHPEAKARAIELEWGEEGWERSPASTENVDYDILISAELLGMRVELIQEQQMCISSRVQLVQHANLHVNAGVVDYHDALLWTMEKLAHPNLVVYSVFCDRPFSYMFFAKLADTHKFNVRPIEFTRHQKGPDGGDDDDAGINMHVITCR